MTKISVTYFQRRPFQDFISIELIFEMIRTELTDTVEPKIHIAKYQSKGIVKRMYNILEAYSKKGDINHVTGDINFLVFGLPRSNTILSLHGTFVAKQHPLIRVVWKLIWWYLPLKRVKYVTVVSSTLKDEVIERFNCNPEKIHIIPNPINPIFKPISKPFSTIPVILQVGVKPAKNIKRLVKALKGIDCILHLVGTLSEEHRVLLKICKIRYKNSLLLTPSQMQTAYAEADIVTLISTYEGFGMPIIEANKVGRVVIAGNVAAIPEVAADAAHLVNPLDVESMRAGVMKVIGDEVYRKQLIQKGFENARRFGVKAISKLYLELYREVLN